MQTEYGKKFGRPDLERIGLFAEMSYMHGKRYQSVKPVRIVGANFLNSGRKTKCGTQHGYFAEEFNRIFEAEAISRRSNKIKQSAKHTIPFIVNSTPKKHATVGDSFGCFERNVPAFSPKLKPKIPFKHEPINFLWRCGKIGGPGYADTGMSKYPEHLPDPNGSKMKDRPSGPTHTRAFLPSAGAKDYFDKNPFLEVPKPTVGLYLQGVDKRDHKPIYGVWQPTGPAKDPGGNHAGCFNPFPKHMPCKYMSQLDANKPSKRKETDVFIPNSIMPKTQYTTSIVNYNVDIGVNNSNFKSYGPSYVKYIHLNSLN